MFENLKIMKGEYRFEPYYEMSNDELIFPFYVSVKGLINSSWIKILNRIHSCIFCKNNIRRYSKILTLKDYKMIRTIGIIICVCFAQTLFGQLKHSESTLYPSYKNLIMSGYQGWFRVNEDGTFFPDEKKVKIDMWPDVSEYEKTYPTSLKLADGSTAEFFNSADESTIDVHFQWMEEYGVDGVFMQRFFGRTRNPEMDDPSVQVLKHAFEDASEYKRAIAVMYDLSGLKSSGEDCSSVIEDWKFLIDNLNVTNQKGTKTYLHHNGKPLVAIWGLGFPDRPYNIRNIGILKLIDFLKNDPVYGGCSIMLGVPTFWRDLNADCLPDPYLHKIIREADIILPWMVQRFTPLIHNDMDRLRDHIMADIEWCDKNDVDYVPCIYPGFSWHNLSHLRDNLDDKPLASIPREGGHFYWDQIYTAINAGADMIYAAMFDEVNEGTAIFKCSDNPPVSDEAKFIDMDGKPSDHYLWLTGQASKMLKDEIPVTIEMPERK